jgi:hypothetical protein
LGNLHKLLNQNEFDFYRKPEKNNIRSACGILAFRIRNQFSAVGRRKSRVARMRTAFWKHMLATLPRHQPAMKSETNSPKSDSAESTSAALEIHSYLAARDLLLREADANTTEANLRRAWAANEFAQSCLRPARSPYQAQALPEAEAAREQLRCNAVKVRLVQLRVRAGLRRRAA